MNDKNFIDSITLYINNELDESLKLEFEKAMDNNEDLRRVFDDIKNNDSLLKKLPKFATKSDFIIELNKRIDMYELKKHTPWFITVKEYFLNLNPAPAFALVCIILIASFSFFKLNNFNGLNTFSSSDSENNSYIAVNDSDSLDVINDSLNYPILLIGNGR